jgi:linoleoyl-CoA desaturase
MSKKGQVKFISHDNEFFSALKSRVDAYFRENNISKNANVSMVIKTITLLAFYLLPFAYICVFNPPLLISMVLWIIMGLSMAGIGMSVMHDANHGAYTSKAKLNKWIGYSLNLLGGSIFNWKLQHNILHHTYTNIAGMDDDIDEKLGMRFSPHTEQKKIQKVQFVYAFFLYSIITLYWVTLKDFIQFARYTREGVNAGNKKENFINILRIVGLKILYYAVVFGIPIFFSSVPFLQILWGFLLMHAVAGLILSVVFQLAHTVEGTSHPTPDENGTIANNWAIHQMNTTKNFSRKSKWISWYVGGLNFQVEHHLFPKICHVHYPEIAHIVKETAEEYGVPYLESPTFMEALDSHIKTLKRFGHIPKLDEILAG